MLLPGKYFCLFFSLTLRILFKFVAGNIVPLHCARTEVGAYFFPFCIPPATFGTAEKLLCTKICEIFQMYSTEGECSTNQLALSFSDI